MDIIDQTVFHDEFIEWFIEKYTIWSKAKIQEIENDCNAIVNKPLTKEEKLKELYDKENEFIKEKVNFIVSCQYEYMDIIFDQYNDKIINKEEMIQRSEELYTSITELLRIHKATTINDSLRRN